MDGPLCFFTSLPFTSFNVAHANVVGVEDLPPTTHEKRIARNMYHVKLRIDSCDAGFCLPK